MGENIDLTRLSSDEQAEYARLGDINTYSTREKLATHRSTVIGIVAWTVIGSALLIAQLSRIDEPHGVALSVFTLVFVLAGFAVIVAAGKPQARRAVAARQAAFLAAIGYADRPMSRTTEA